MVFISNENKCCPFWNQNVAVSGNRPICWDYHVVFICKLELWLVWDLDTLAGFPIFCSDYLRLTFGEHDRIPECHLPYFRVVEVDNFVHELSSSRSHMRTQTEEWLAPPPPWPPILQGNRNTLNDFIDITLKKIGIILTLGEFTRQFAT